MDVLTSPSHPAPSPSCHYLPSPRRVPRKLPPLSALPIPFNGGHRVSHPNRPMVRGATQVGSVCALRAAANRHRRLSTVASSPTSNAAPARVSLRARRIHHAARPPPLQIPSVSSSSSSSDADNDELSPRSCEAPPLRDDDEMAVVAPDSPELPSATTWILEDEYTEAGKQQKELAVDSLTEAPLVELRMQQQQEEEGDAEAAELVSEPTPCPPPSAIEVKKARVAELEDAQQERRGRLQRLMATVHSLMLETRRARLGHGSII